MERYSKVKRIGSGTFGQAWLVESTVSKRTYALKELGVTAMSEQDRHLALNEAKILSKLKHKNIVRYKEAFVDQGKLCIAMEFAEKGDLYTRIRERNGLYFPETQILEWFTQLCLALKYIHGQNILHRDLKTQNIFLGKDDIIKLGDFGIARMLNNTLDHAQTTVGTPYYLSPEICQKKPYNHKSDMWSLGCVLYEIATLKHAFNANNFSALVIKILQGQYPPIPGCYGPLLEDLVSVLLQKNPNDRPSAKQLLYVPAMQPYVKRLLQYERERVDSVASDISDISSRSNADCPRSRISSSGKTEKAHGEENMVNSSNIAKQDGQVKQTPNISLENARSSSKEQRFSTDKAPITTAQGNCRSSSSGPNSCVDDIAPKTRIVVPGSDNTSKARENLPARCPADTNKRSLLALAHAHQRRHSEQTSARPQPCSRVPKGRIHSQGAQARVNSVNEDDVFAVNYPTVIPKRKPDVKNSSKPRECKNRVSNASVSCANRVATVTEEQKQKPSISLCQPKSREVMRTRMRHQSAAITSDSNRCAIEQKHRRLATKSEMNRVNKERVNKGAPSQTHVQVLARPRSCSSALQQIQTTNTENQPTVKTNSETTGNEREIRKRTYTVSQERRPSAFEIPDADGENKQNDENGSCKGGKGSSKDGNGSGNVRDLRNEKFSLCRDNESKIFEKQFNYETMVHVPAEITGPENKRRVLPPSCKFTFCGKTLHLDNVSSQDSIYSQLEALRMYLEKELGTRLLTAVYRYVTNASFEEHDRIKQTVTAMLGEDKMKYFPVLLQLVACEAIYFH